MKLCVTVYEPSGTRVVSVDVSVKLVYKSKPVARATDALGLLMVAPEIIDCEEASVPHWLKVMIADLVGRNSWDVADDSIAILKEIDE